MSDSTSSKLFEIFCPYVCYALIGWGIASIYGIYGKTPIIFTNHTNSSLQDFQISSQGLDNKRKIFHLKEFSGSKTFIFPRRNLGRNIQMNFTQQGQQHCIILHRSCNIYIVHDSINIYSKSKIELEYKKKCYRRRGLDLIPELDLLDCKTRWK